MQAIHLLYWQSLPYTLVSEHLLTLLSLSQFSTMKLKVKF